MSHSGFTLAAISVAMIVWGLVGAQQGRVANKFELTSEFFMRTYCKNLVRSETVRLSDTPGLNISRVRSILASSQKARSVDFSRMGDLLESTNSTLLDIFSPGKDLKFALECLNLSSNAFSDQFLMVGKVDGLLGKLRFVELVDNRIEHLDRHRLEVFENSPLEALLIDSNEITSVRHDSFAALGFLKYISLSNNRIKLIHPLTFSPTPNLIYLNLAYNRLQAVFKTPTESNATSLPLKSLKYLFLNGNDELACDCGLLWLYKIRLDLVLDDFRCRLNSSSTLLFRSMPSQRALTDNCPRSQLFTDTSRLAESSSISLFRDMSKRWFAWNLLHDEVPPVIPYPYLRSSDSPIDELDPNATLDDSKHVFHSWQYDDAVFECSTQPNRSASDASRSTIIWKTQFGYLSFLDKELMEAVSGDNFDSEWLSSPSIPFPNYYSFKIFYKMNKLTKIYKNLTVRIGKKFGTETRSMMYVKENNQLVVTNMRQVMAGPIVCIAINERSVNTYEYDIRVRSGVSEYFIYSLIISALSMIVPSILGLVVCCVCEYQADKNYPMTPPCYPTPIASTPPNFDFNEWMSNAASYLPDFNIQETLEQVSKRLRKGMEKASVTVKSLGMTSSAYIYSMYEQSSQRWSDIKHYVPTLNVPNLTLPTMRYPANMGQLANRMRTGMGNMFVHFREFCGTTDMTHTPSIVDLDAETNASNAVGKNYILDELKQQHTNRSNYYRFLSLIREESRLMGQQANESQPTTSNTGQGSTSTSASTSSGALPINNNMLPVLKFEPADDRNENESSFEPSEDEDRADETSKSFLKSLKFQSGDHDENINERTAKIDPALGRMSTPQI